MHVMMFIASTGRGGAESLVVNLCNQLCSRQRVTVIAFEGGQWLDQLKKSVEVVIIGPRQSRRSPLLYFRLIRIFRRVRPDIIHAHGAKAAEIIKFLDRFVGIPFLATKHNDRRGSVFNRIKHVVAVSSKVADTVKGGHVSVIYNGIIPLEHVKSCLPKDTFSLLAVGRLDRVKGFDLVIRAMAELPEKVTLKIVGEGEELEALDALIKQLALSERVHLLGYRNDIPQLMANAHAVIVSSYSEGFSLVMAESLFYANLLLSTKVGIASEILPERLCLSINYLARQLQEAYANYVEYCQIFEQIGKQYRQQFHASQMAEDYIKLYQEILKE